MNSVSRAGKRGSRERWEKSATGLGTTYTVLNVDVRSLVLHLLVFRKKILDILVGELVEFFIGDIGRSSGLEFIRAQRLGQMLTSRERASES